MSGIRCSAHFINTPMYKISSEYNTYLEHFQLNVQFVNSSKKNTSLFRLWSSYPNWCKKIYYFIRTQIMYSLKHLLISEGRVFKSTELNAKFTIRSCSTMCTLLLITFKRLFIFLLVCFIPVSFAFYRKSMIFIWS